MGRAYSTRADMLNASKMLVGKLEKFLEDNVYDTTTLKRVQMHDGRNQWWTLVKTVVNVRIPQYSLNFN